ncbi:hypothetical protein AVDCRST_MAG94-2235 [uncultured Leptolyngbya sp.]|uniref:TraX family protein n=1 Tax=uncultured Leptolyngbya sp. TaxID=332963 RepID=A0A6J4LPH1_9CYAN|nr:hypothetical protein AVDCRST_MAG94-2235 [uncultured Leptolyngbya sp.]
MSQLALKPLPVTAFDLKVLAALLMVVDHIGLVLEVEWLRIVGRFSFPLFAWLLVQGAKHTQNWHKYQKRLLMLAIASQPIYALFIKSLLPLNPVFQLWLGLILVRLIQEQQMTLLLGVAIIGVAAFFVDYHYYGIGLVYLLASCPYLLKNLADQVDSRVNLLLWIGGFAVLHFQYALSHPLQIYALPFVILLPLLNTVRDRGPKARWFYWFYPLHFVPLILLGAS